MKLMNVAFVPTADNDKAVDLIVDGHLIQSDIPVHEPSATDHRGTALYFFLSENDFLGGDWNDFKFEKGVDTFEIKRAFDYMFRPKHVLESMIERDQEREARKNYKKSYK